jgi:enamine deaminase RidA (YjgF/YER057c/UK114 family)
MSVAERLAALGLEVPEVVAPVAAYVPARRSRDAVYVSGQLPFVNGKLPIAGTVGLDVTPEQAHDLARICALNAIAALASVVDLEDVRGIVKVVGFVASAPGFTGQPLVVNGASELLVAAFGDIGVHSRSAVGVTALPLGTPVEIELIAEV